ncbi:hypothetical protein ETD83_01005 [Actinomadura soli]|uniref:Uncharacterized protein n=1 Tax=Actinomadura soli TaxID=2508997 RepID=A0A5C4JJT8_9ACTN|nr:hypothetical protein [Actinomadura soli]TMR07356.1 hypothetical protein ETD83_01005 [Actinomadura soli]
MSGTVGAAAESTETVCGTEVELGSLVYQMCSDVVHVGETSYGTQPFMEARNRGISSVDLSLTLQHWDPAASGWATDSNGSRTLEAGSSTRYFGPPSFWPCGLNAQERGQATTTVGTGDWADVITPPAC